MDSEPSEPRDETEHYALVEGLVIAALLSIPLWAAIAAIAIAFLQEGPLSAVQSAAFVIAAAVEAILLRYVWRRHALKAHVSAFFARTAQRAIRRPFLRQAALLGGLVVAYLHYYFWDVHLQIAQLNHVTVFI